MRYNGMGDIFHIMEDVRINRMTLLTDDNTLDSGSDLAPIKAHV
jgi:hypothetical protein